MKLTMKLQKFSTKKILQLLFPVERELIKMKNIYTANELKFKKNPEAKRYFGRIFNDFLFRPSLK